jgi:hypothetical protein
MTDTRIQHFCINGMSALALYAAGAIDLKEYLRRRKEEDNGN